MPPWTVTIMVSRVLVYLFLAASLLAAAACGSATASAGSSTAAAETHTLGAPTAASTGAAATASHTAQPSLTPTITRTPTPSLTPTATPCADTQGQFSSISVPSTVLSKSISTRVYLPPCYGSTGLSYPVLYLLHGLNFTEDQWERLGVGPAAEALVATGDIAPMIIVMPRVPDDIRFDPAFVVDLVPYVDTHYRTLAGRPYRAIGGMSRGAGWAIHLGLRYPEVFGRVGGHSPAIMFEDDTNVLSYAITDAKRGVAPEIFIDVGDADAQRQSAFWLDQLLTSLSIGHTYIFRPGNHSEAYWTAHLSEYLLFYAHDWLHEPYTPTPTPRPTATGATPTS